MNRRKWKRTRVKPHQEALREFFLTRPGFLASARARKRHFRYKWHEGGWWYKGARRFTKRSRLLLTLAKWRVFA